MKKIRIRAIVKSYGFKKVRTSHNEVIYENSEGKHIYLYSERDRYNLDIKLYGRDKASKSFHDYFDKDIVFSV